MAQSSLPQNTPPDASSSHAAPVIEDPASGTVDVDAGGKVSTVEAGAAATRLDAVDLLRGLVMVIMALDHTRDFFHADALLYQPTDLTKATPLLFFTRWITHFCAPTFVFLAGTGAFLSVSRGKTKRQLSWFLFTRGLWLILLELTVVRLSWSPLAGLSFYVLQVIWALGVSMIVLAGLIHLPVRLIAAVGLLMIATHNLLDRFTAERFGSLGSLWRLLHEQGLWQPTSGLFVFVAYPLIPWIGVMAAGYAFGQLLLLERARRRKVLLALGLSMTLAFIVLRTTNLYGDPHAWVSQQSAVYTLLSFLNTEKYPPSLLFLLMTLGPAIALLTLFERVRGALARFFITFGRVPLFFYLLHIPLIHLIALISDFARYRRPVGDIAFLTQTPPPAGYGYSLAVVYLVWLGVVVALYPLCRWFAGVKRRRRAAWLSYL
ncbi:MAG TPA: heparan-alpha-glucosaminide N-acetyltransferase domain-containing protein [Pyrinomonadaceae bacterium]|nr:heparan-alpha-glucosaminide N-acetyltransferase domain-containing protein [Pyrinomonadaceae bacterium]